MLIDTKKNVDESIKKKEVLFLGRENCEASSKALNHLKKLDFEVTTFLSKGLGDLLPKSVSYWAGDYIFCFRSTFILPMDLIDKAKSAAINFHPGPPEYPGSGCINYALYENSKHYGVTSHLMTEKVDDGSIIEFRKFPIYVTDTVNSLIERTHVKLLDLFFDVTDNIALHEKKYIDKSVKNSKKIKWSSIKRKIKDLDNLSIIEVTIDKKELERIIRATYTENFPTKILLHGYEFLLKSDKNND